MDLRPAQTIGPGTLLQDRYEVRELVQELAGSRAFHGLDLRMGREVRIRVFDLPAPSEVEAYAALDHRALQLAPLHHPNLQPFFDAGMLRREGYAVMAWQEGETLARRLKREGPLAWEDAKGILEDVTAALAYAHARGVAHQRLIPEAVFLDSDGLVQLRDFAQGLVDACPSGPDGAADALGLDLRMLRDLTLATVRPPELPPLVAEALDRAIQTAPGGHALRDLLAVLASPQPRYRAPRRRRALALGLGLVGLAALAVAALLYVRRPPRPIPTLAILPIEGDLDRTDDAPLRTQIPEHLRQAMTRWRGIRLTSGTPEASPADFRLGGRLIHEDGGPMLTLFLTRSADGKELWRRTLPFSSQGMLGLQADLRSQLGKALDSPISDRASGSGGRTPTMPAFHALMRARHFLAARTPEGFLKADKALEEALALDPSYAAAYATRAECLNLKAVHLMITADEALAGVKEAAGRALALDPGEAEARCSLAYARFRFAWDWAGAEKEFRQALAEDPDNPLIHHWYGFFLSCLGRWDESILELKTAVDLDPLGAQAATNLGVAYLWSGQTDRGLAEFRKVMDLDPRFLSVRDRLIGGLESAGRVQEALDERLARIALAPQTQGGTATLQAAFQRGGAPAYWAALEEQHLPMFRKGLDVFAVAYPAAAQGHDDLAFESLGRIIDTRHPMAVWIPRDTAFRRLRSDPRWKPLMARLNFPEK